MGGSGSFASLSIVERCFAGPESTHYHATKAERLGRQSS